MNNNYNIAVSAINLFSDGLSSNNYVKVREALDMVRNEGFSWDGLEIVKKWDELILELGKRYESAKAKLA